MNEIKETKWEPELEIIRFGIADIVTTSGDGQLDPDELPPIIVG